LWVKGILYSSLSYCLGERTNKKRQKERKKKKEKLKQRGERKEL
jgi:hypothetical protein